MAGFCTRCGAPLNEGVAFCTQCGAPAGTTSGAAEPSPTPYTPPASNPPAAYTPPVYTPPASSAPPSAYAPPPAYAGVGTAPPQKSGNTALKIILIIVAVFVGLGILGAAGVSYVVYRASKVVHVNHDGSAVELTTPGGTFSAGDTAVSASDLGIDLYPGASQQKGAVRISTPKGSTVTAVFETTDSLDKVIAWYKDKLGSGASIFQSEKSAVLTLADDAKKTSVMVTISNEDNDGKTKIAVMHSVGS
jgi:hypothetical protein